MVALSELPENGGNSLLYLFLGGGLKPGRRRLMSTSLLKKRLVL